MRAIDADELLKQQYTMGFGQMPVVSVDAIKNAPTITPPNEPLTLEQLREMDGEPVWVVVSENWRKTGIKDGWRLVCFHINDDRVRLYMFDTRAGARFFSEQDMGRSYWVYRRPPEGEA